jgi:hypothetical protein
MICSTRGSSTRRRGAGRVRVGSIVHTSIAWDSIDTAHVID